MGQRTRCLRWRIFCRYAWASATAKQEHVHPDQCHAKPRKLDVLARRESHAGTSLCSSPSLSLIVSWHRMECCCLRHALVRESLASVCAGVQTASQHTVARCTYPAGMHILFLQACTSKVQRLVCVDGVSGVCRAGPRALTQPGMA